MAIIDKAASQQIERAWSTTLKVWGRILTFAVFVLATIATMRVLGYGVWVAVLPGAGASFMDLMLAAGVVSAARFCARQ